MASLNYFSATLSNTHKVVNTHKVILIVQLIYVEHLAIKLQCLIYCSMVFHKSG